MLASSLGLARLGIHQILWLVTFRNCCPSVCPIGILSFSVCLVLLFLGVFMESPGLLLIWMYSLWLSELARFG